MLKTTAISIIPLSPSTSVIAGIGKKDAAHIEMTNFNGNCFVDVDRLADHVKDLINKGVYKIVIDCGPRGIMLGKYAITRWEERVSVDILKSGLPRRIQEALGKSLSVTEEIKRSSLFSKKRIYLTLELDN